MAPPISTASGTINNAWASERASEIAPTRYGEGTSPRIWIAKMLRATAVARVCGDTALTMAELIGPVEAKRHSSAATMDAVSRLGVWGIEIGQGVSAASVWAG